MPKRRCELGTACPYQHQYQHGLEFSHGNEPSEPKTRKANGGGGSAGSGKPRSPRKKKWPGDGIMLATGNVPKKRGGKKATDNGGGRTLGGDGPAPAPARATRKPKAVKAAGNAAQKRNQAQREPDRRVKQEVIEID